MDSSINRRIPIVFLVFMLLYGIIFINLYRIQIRHHTFFASLGKKQYHKQIITHAPRAAIYDRHGNVLALNKEGLSAFVSPKHIMHKPEVKEFLKNYFPDAYERLLTHENHNFMYIKRRLTTQEEQLLRAQGFSDITFITEPSRMYPAVGMGTIIGGTDIDNQGLCGIELMYNKHLAGMPTISVLEKDARSGNFYFSKQFTQEGKEGAALTLTLDSNLQFLVYEELKKSIDLFNAVHGAALVMDPDNGELLALVNIPDLEQHTLRTTSLEIKNRVVSDAYELGSVMKVFTALAALEEKVVTFDELIDCHNSATSYIDGRTVNTAPGTTRGIIPFYEVIAVSNNIGIAQVAKRLGPKLYEHYQKLGFGRKTTLELPGEQAGYITPPAYWSKQSIISLSYGYEIAVTLIQLARAFGIIAHNGYPIQPTILLQDTVRPEEQLEPLYSSQAIAFIKEILERTTRTGTAKRAAIKGYKIMSKTGTANMIIDGAYDTTKNIYTCAGIVQKGSYQRVIITCIQQACGTNLYASTVAAPLFERIAEKTLIHDKIV